jgi:Zn-dependent M28 family amino/carboxypeptidase
MKTLILTTLLLSSTAFAHGDQDWREDYEAFLSVSYETLPMTKANVPFSPRVDMDFFKEKLIVLASNERKSTAGLDKARAFLSAEYKKIGFDVSLAPFGSGVNIIAEKKGTTHPEKILIISAHIDSVGNMGANDDGTGTIGLLTVSQILAKHEYPITIRVLGFDREEVGLKGSDAYVAALTNKADIIGDIHFEMMGYNSRKDGAFHVIDCNSGIFGGNRPVENSQFLSQSMKESIAELNLNLTVSKACTDRSDHASFWRHKIPAIVISENFFGGDSDPCYHAKCDIVDDRLDYDYMGKILEALLRTIEKQAAL